MPPRNRPEQKFTEQTSTKELQTVVDAFATIEKENINVIAGLWGGIFAISFAKSLELLRYIPYTGPIYDGTLYGWLGKIQYIDDNYRYDNYEFDLTNIRFIEPLFRKFNKFQQLHCENGCDDNHSNATFLRKNLIAFLQELAQYYTKDNEVLTLATRASRSAKKTNISSLLALLHGKMTAYEVIMAPANAEAIRQIYGWNLIVKSIKQALAVFCKPILHKAIFNRISSDFNYTRSKELTSLLQEEYIDTTSAEQAMATINKQIRRLNKIAFVSTLLNLAIFTYLAYNEYSQTKSMEQWEKFFEYFTAMINLGFIGHTATQTFRFYRNPKIRQAKAQIQHIEKTTFCRVLTKDLGELVLDQSNNTTGHRYFLKFNKIGAQRDNIVCQVVKAALLNHGITFHANPNTNWLEIPSYTNLDLARAQAQTINSHVQKTLDRLDSLIGLASQLGKLTEAFFGDGRKFKAIPTKDAKGLPIKIFTIPLHYACLSLFQNNSRLEKIFPDSTITVTNNTIVVESHEPGNPVLLDTLIKDIRKTIAAHVAKQIEDSNKLTEFTSDADNSSDENEPEESTDNLVPEALPQNVQSALDAQATEQTEQSSRRKPLPTPKKEAKTNSTEHKGDSKGETKGSTIKVLKEKEMIEWKHGTYDPTQVEQKKTPSFIAYYPGMFFSTKFSDGTSVAPEVRAKMERGKAAGAHGDGVRIFNTVYKNINGRDIVGDIKFAGPGGRGTRRVWLTAEISKKDKKTLLIPVEDFNKKHVKKPTP